MIYQLMEGNGPLEEDWHKQRQLEKLEDMARKKTKNKKTKKQKNKKP